MSLPVVSIVVASYGRFDHIKTLIESARSIFPEGEYEVVAVCSDDPEGEKVQWLRDQPDVTFIQGDVRGTCRQHSLYWYENIGIKASKGEWVFVTNDDTILVPTFYDKLKEIALDYDVILVKGHIGEVGLGARIPSIGTIKRPWDSEPQPLYLYDFSIIRRWVYDYIGYLDEGLDWFGKGFDLAMKVEFLATRQDAKIAHDSEIEVTHTITGECRTPPNHVPDFTYATKKWEKWCAENPGHVFSWPW
ncbi:MAG: glycosyltransferase family 2 protein [Planctomycetota bacterium]|jgi:GT2 family glycosyltransferase